LKDGFDETDEADDWDPIEEMIEDQRANYVCLIRHFLWIETPDLSADMQEFAIDTDTIAAAKAFETKESSKKRKADKRRAKAKKGSPPALTTSASASASTATPLISDLESREEIRARLEEGYRLSFCVQGKFQNKYSTVSDDEIEVQLGNIAEINLLLFCRLLLGQATLLPAALKAQSINELLEDPNVSVHDLRSLCLKVASPGLQEVRDACADLGRRLFRTVDPLPDTWTSNQELEKKKQGKNLLPAEEEDQPAIDLGIIEDDRKPTRVEVCGMSIWDYASHTSMSRPGWLQFAIMVTKHISLFDFFTFCRGWNEFFNLHMLSQFDYFPTKQWQPLGTNPSVDELLRLGFVRFYDDSKQGQHFNRSVKTRGKGPGQEASYDIAQARSIVGAHMNRNDPVSRRFIKYISLCTSQVCVSARDAKTGKYLTRAPTKQCWLVRTKEGKGNPKGKKWIIHERVNQAYLEHFLNWGRKFRFGFQDCYEVHIWSLLPGRAVDDLYPIIQQVSMAMCISLTRGKTNK
jgi:hypothetical protein